jgi:hypothetical protein
MKFPHLKKQRTEARTGLGFAPTNNNDAVAGVLSRHSLQFGTVHRSSLRFVAVTCGLKRGSRKTQNSLLKQ